MFNLFVHKIFAICFEDTPRAPSEAATRAVLLKKVFLEISQNSRLWHRCFPVDFVKFQRTSFYRTPLDYCFLIIFLRKSWSQNHIYTLEFLKMWYGKTRVTSLRQIHKQTSIHHYIFMWFVYWNYATRSQPAVYSFYKADKDNLLFFISWLQF